MQPMLKNPVDGKYYSIPEIMLKYKTVELKYISSNKSIQVRDMGGKFIGCLKYDWGGENAAKTVSGGTGAESA